HRSAEDVAVVAAGQASIAGQHQEQRTADGFVSNEQGVRDRLQCLAEIGDQLGNLARERLGLGCAVQRLAGPSGGHELHGAGDLCYVLDRLAAFDNRSGFGHRGPREVRLSGGVARGRRAAVRVQRKWLALKSAIALESSDSILSLTFLSRSSVAQRSGFRSRM